ncbi:hypothetical protein AArcSl_1354 [Halalkaliarchaeum desulfuricum]|uniref:DUF7282 domain-containing protein n=1 Tax=Halalkaliarchaeum desulfuricum TaxID=2055893 RepID=A0A343TIR3_9EURY|nr:hypothetical protein AArcSl_1354 [Halalkaliarchaeum desulfuricum]
MLRGIGVTGIALAGFSSGTVTASHDPDEFRIEFNKQTRRLDVEEPSVLVASAHLPESGFVMVHETHDHDMGNMSDSGCPDMHEIYGDTDILDPGHYGGITVPLDKSPDEAGTEELVAMIHEVDNGDDKICPPEIRQKADVRFIEADRSR